MSFKANQWSHGYKIMIVKFIKSFNFGKPVVTEWFIRILKDEISKKLYINKLSELADECNNTIHLTIKMMIM